MLSQLWTGGYILDWAGLIVEFLGAALAAFGILPRGGSGVMVDRDSVYTSPTFLLLQSKQIRSGLVIMAVGCLLQCIGTFQEALPLFAK